AVFRHLQRHVNEQDRSSRVGIAPSVQAESPLAAALKNDIRDAPSDPDGVRRGCRQIGEYIRQPGKYGEPYSRLVAGVCKNCGPDAKPIYLGWLDPEWRAVGEGYFDRWHVGPPFCKRFEELNPGGCGGCAI